MNKNNQKEKNNKRKKLKININVILYIISIILFASSFLIFSNYPILEKYKIYIYLLIIILSGYELIISGIKNIFKLNFEEDTLMTIAVIAAFVLGEYPESCMVILLFRLGEFLEEKAVENSNKNIEDIIKIKSNTANLIKENGEIQVLDVEKIKVGENILIKPGEIVPLDCIILEGISNIDTSAITGESKLVEVQGNKNILSGTINLTGVLKCKVLKDSKNSTASQIIDLVYQATNNKGKTEEFITKFSKIYTPIAIIGAVLLTIIPVLFFGQDIKDWIMRSLVFLVAACPCSIVISIPLAFFSCIGKISKKGMLIKGTKHIEALAKANIIAFDKTGTITTGKIQIDKIYTAEGFDEKENLIYMYNLEKNSNHPISTAIIKEIEKRNLKQNKQITNYEEIAGCGIYAKIDQKQVLFGNKKLLRNYNILEIEEIKEEANYLVIDNKIAGYITLKEEIREDANNIAKQLNKINIKNIIMLTGDNKQKAEEISNQINIKNVFSELLPKEKLEKIKELKKDGKVIFVGDGINDSPVLAECDFGISIGEGTQIANNVADGILISNNIGSIPEIIKIARKSMNIIKFNILFSLFFKVVVFALGILGLAPIWLAIVADTGVSLITVLNSIRILK